MRKFHIKSLPLAIFALGILNVLSRAIPTDPTMRRSLQRKFRNHGSKGLTEDKNVLGSMENSRACLVLADL